MPKIPRFTQSARLSQSQAGRITSPSAARLQGEQIARFGQQVSQAGGQIGAYVQQRQDTKRRLDVEENVVELEGVANQAMAEASNLSNPEVAADGNNMVNLFESTFDDQLNLQLQEVDDENTKRLIQLKAADLKNKHLANLRVKEEAQFATYNAQRQEEVLNKRSALVAQDPSSLDQNLSEYEKSVNESNLFSPADKERILKISRKDFAMSAVTGMVQAKDYDKAKALLGEKFQEEFSQEERNKISRHIDSEKARVLNIELLEQSRREKAEEERIQLEQRENLANYIDKFEGAENDGQRVALITEMTQQARAGGLPPKAMEVFSRQETAKVKMTSGLVNQELIRMQRDGASASELQDAVVARMALMDRSTLNKWLKQTGLEKTRSASDPLYKERNRVAQNFIKNTIFPMGTSFVSDQMNQRYERVMNSYIDKKAQGLSPRDAANSAIKNEYGDLKLIPRVSGLEGIDQNSLEGIEKGKQKLTELYKNKEIDPKTFKERVLILIERENALKAADIQVSEVNNGR
jgi:hypothetical protein